MKDMVQCCSESSLVISLIRLFGIGIQVDASLYNWNNVRLDFERLRPTRRVDVVLMPYVCSLVPLEQSCFIQEGWMREFLLMQLCLNLAWSGRFSWVHIPANFAYIGIQKDN